MLLCEKKLLKINLSIAAILLAINLLTYRFLPSQIALQIDTRGDLTSFIPKILFVFITPLILSLLSVRFYYKKELQLYIHVIVDVVLVGITLFSIFMNLK